MADTKTTALTAMTTPLTTDIMYIVDDPGGSPAGQKITLANLRSQLTPHAAVGGRLTLTTATPVTTADVTAAATLYFTPYSGSQFCGQIGLYDGSAKWDVLDFTELSLSLAGYTASKPYDIWCYNNSGTPTLDSTIWTDGTTRATALTTQDGIYVKTGATTRRYLGTIYINASGGQTNDSLTKRFVWNYYNRVLRSMYVGDTTAHNYETGTYRSWNNDAAIRLEFVLGLVENWVQTITTAFAETSAHSIGYDSTSTAVDGTATINLLAVTTLQRVGVSFNHLPGIGYHYYQAVEFGAVGATQSQQYVQAAIWG